MSQLNATKYMELENGQVIQQDCYLDTNGLVLTGFDAVDFDEPTLVENEYAIDEFGTYYTVLPYAVLAMMNDAGEELDDEYGNGIAIYYE